MAPGGDGPDLAIRSGKLVEFSEEQLLRLDPAVRISDQSNDGARFVRNGAGPVSSTHLKLPTVSSVPRGRRAGTGSQ